MKNICLTPLAVYENDGRQPAEPLLRLVPGVRHLPADHHRGAHASASVRRRPP